MLAKMFRIKILFWLASATAEDKQWMYLATQHRPLHAHMCTVTSNHRQFLESHVRDCDPGLRGQYKPGLWTPDSTMDSIFRTGISTVRGQRSQQATEFATKLYPLSLY